MTHHEHRKNAASKIRSLLSQVGGKELEITSGGTNSILASLFRRMLKELDINYSKWNNMMVRYIMDPRNCIPNNNKDQASARGNLQKELLKEKMSWKVFCKGLRFMAIPKFEIIIKAHHPNGKITEHSLPVNLGQVFDLNIPDDFSDEKDNEDD
jgi:hypothetical protein